MGKMTAYWLTIAGIAIQGCGWLATASAETPRRIAVGVYFNEETRYCPSDEQAFAELQAQTGRLAKVYLNFQSWTEEWNQFSTRLGDNSLKHGGVFMVVWMPARGEDGPGRSDPGWSCKAVAAGQHDAYIKRYAADVKAWGKPLMIRLAHEMNGSWYPYGTAFDSPGVRHNKNAPADYVAMWRHIWAIFHDAGAENVTWVWSPNIFYINANNSLAQQQADYRALYPGDGYVDWIGLDGYCDGVKGKWKTFPELFDASYRAITAIAARPLMIAEFACSEAGRRRGPARRLGSSRPTWQIFPTVTRESSWSTGSAGTKRGRAKLTGGSVPQKPRCRPTRPP